MFSIFPVIVSNSRILVLNKSFITAPVHKTEEGRAAPVQLEMGTRFDVPMLIAANRGTFPEEVPQGSKDPSLKTIGCTGAMDESTAGDSMAVYLTETNSQHLSPSPGMVRGA